MSRLATRYPHRNRSPFRQRISGERRALLMLAVRLMARYEADYAAYLEDARESTRGVRIIQGEQMRVLGVYRVHYCEHGATRWTDYDNICGGCEGGWTMADVNQRRERALVEARQRMARYDALVGSVELLRQAGVELDPEQRREISRAAFRALDASEYFA